MIEEDIKIAISLYKDYARTNTSFCKLCCMHDIVYTYSCNGPITRCPYALITNEGIKCVVCTRVSCLK